MDQNTAHDLAVRFQALMAAKRTGTLVARQPDTTTNPPASSSSSAATPPQPLKPTSHPFYAEIQSLSHHLDRYNAPGLIDHALETIDLGVIYSAADEASTADTSNDLGYQDHVIKALLHYFKTSFFTWVTNPPCSTCQAECQPIGGTAPSPEEVRLGANRTEIYRCTRTASHAPTRFPRYNNPATLLTSRRGRCGEFANCFTLLCLAFGSRARWVWNAEDHVWTEVYSEHLGRWVHCDSCEDAWDAPRTYAVGWGKKMSYCFAFGMDGARDVSRRYVRRREELIAGGRGRADESVVEAAIEAVTKRLRFGRGEDEIRRLEEEDEREVKELEGFWEVSEATKVQEEMPRESGAADWKRERGEDGTGN